MTSTTQTTSCTYTYHTHSSLTSSSYAINITQQPFNVTCYIIIMYERVRINPDGTLRLVTQFDAADRTKIFGTDRTLCPLHWSDACFNRFRGPIKVLRLDVPAVYFPCDPAAHNTRIRVRALQQYGSATRRYGSTYIRTIYYELLDFQNQSDVLLSRVYFFNHSNFHIDVSRLHVLDILLPILFRIVHQSRVSNTCFC